MSRSSTRRRNAGQASPSKVESTSSGSYFGSLQSNKLFKELHSAEAPLSVSVNPHVLLAQRAIEASYGAVASSSRPHMLEAITYELRQRRPSMRRFINM